MPIRKEAAFEVANTILNVGRLSTHTPADLGKLAAYICVAVTEDEAKQEQFRCVPPAAAQEWTWPSPAQADADTLTLVLRLLGEDPDTFAPETREVMDRWRPIAEAIMGSQHEITPARAREILATETNWGEMTYSQEERIAITSVWLTMSGRSSFNDAVRRIASLDRAGVSRG